MAYREEPKRISFNPRSRKGNDQALKWAFVFMISFNPRSRKGNDTSFSFPNFISDSFQSTFPQGERRSIPVDRKGVHRFNPRSRKGNDSRWILGITEIRLFQSTFPQGERLIRNGIIYAVSTFQSTFPQGERPDQRVRICTRKGVSIHVPARGTTYSTPLTCRIQVMFQSTFPQGERHRSIQLIPGG